MEPLDVFIYVLCVSIALKGGITPELENQLTILAELVVYAWSIEFVNLVICGGALNGLGIRPRTSSGLLGIFFSPFLHADWEHLLGNTIPFVILGWFVMLTGMKIFFIVTVFTPLFSGLGIWLFGRLHTNHIGASDVIFGYLGFLLLHSYFERDSLSIVLTAIVGFVYGRLLWGIFPIRYGVSWEGHLFGLIAGILVARFLETFKVIVPA
ncbi:MAG: rhomboid family intramembrane serine protease [Tolypothrix sp. T3-bin4]|nr:rhomboid family intramembrane serine protease [Tolypothrix sp. T3-bin4]